MFLEGVFELSQEEKEENRVTYSDYLGGDEYVSQFLSIVDLPGGKSIDDGLKIKELEN